MIPRSGPISVPPNADVHETRGSYHITLNGVQIGGRTAKPSVALRLYEQLLEATEGGMGGVQIVHSYSIVVENVVSEDALLYDEHMDRARTIKVS